MNAKLRHPMVHIGLGKTATTSLQKYVFPKIAKIRDEIIYNEKALIEKLSRRSFMTLDEEKLFQAKFRLGRNFISLESLVAWNPRNWVEAADQNLRLFGRDTTIIITLTETEDYLCSVYQQMVHQGNIWDPSKFFVCRQQYDRMDPFLPRLNLLKFDVDSFDLEFLHQLYLDRFENVLIVPLSSINELRFVKEIIDLDENELRLVREEMKTGRRQNRSYSKIAMACTMRREKLLNKIGLMSYGSVAREVDIPIHNQSPISFRDLSVIGKLRRLPHCILSKFLRELQWRRIMQGYLDRIIPYKKYRLPGDIYKNVELAKKNDDFIRSFE